MKDVGKTGKFLEELSRILFYLTPALGTTEAFEDFTRKLNLYQEVNTTLNSNLTPDLRGKLTYLSEKIKSEMKKLSIILIAKTASFALSYLLNMQPYLAAEVLSASLGTYFGSREGIGEKELLEYFKD